jgi:hypothetical protein
MAKIRKIKDSNNEVIYPVTTVEAIQWEGESFLENIDLFKPIFY